MTIHPREENVRLATIELRDYWTHIKVKHELTPGERLRIVGTVIDDEIGLYAKYLIREERHGDQNKPGGLA